MDLSIIIVTYNTKDLTLQCLQSLIRLFAYSIEIIVVDNASTDGTVSAIKEKYPQIKIITNHKNLGFGAANNLGAREAKGDYLFFLNSDTIATPNAILELLKHHSDIATCRLVNPNGSLQPQGGFLPNLINIPLWMLNLDQLPIIRNLFKPYQLRYPSFFNHNQSMGWLCGAALMVQKSIFNQLGGFDPKIFMYAEDLDLCFRAFQLGVKPQYFHEPQITHLGQGTGSSRAILGEYRGLIYYFQKHKPVWQLSIIKFWLKLGALIRALVFGMIGHYDRSQIYEQAYKLV